ncbi:hypothetical protein OAH74_06575 [Amylibacter sp.]|nr:hypothetical protein [Amylibacter sp.]
MTWIKKSLFIFGILLCFTMLILAWIGPSYPPVFFLRRSFVLLLLALTLFLILLIIKFVALRVVFTPIIAILLSLSVAEEISFKYLEKNRTYFAHNTEFKRSYLKRVDGFGYRPNPGSYNAKKFISSGEVIYDVVYSIGDDGYRQDSVSKHFDAYIFGGSFTFGEGVQDDETISAFLSNDHGIKVKNIGMHGYGLHQALYNIQNGISAKNAVNILLTSPWHANRSTCKPSWVKGTFRYQVNDGLAILNGVCPGGYFLNRVLSKSFFYSLLLKVTETNALKITDQSIELYLAIINSIYQETLKNNSSLVIAHIDASEAEMYSTKWTNQSIINRLNDLSDFVIDVTLAEKIEQISPEFILHRLDNHPSALANRNRANLISDYFKR